LDSPGGFIWWYLDLVDKSGNGAVLIWAFGLPFLARKTPQNIPTTPRNRPSFCLALYRNYRQFFYLLQEYPHDSTTTGQGCREVSMGKNSFRTVMGETRVSFSAHIETPVPGSRHALIGTVTAEGNLLQGAREPDAFTNHRWCPVLANTTGRIALKIGADQIVDLQGRAYFDSNFSPTPLDQLEIDLWRWTRVAFDGRDLIFYELQPRDPARNPKQILLTVDSAGRIKIKRLSSIRRSNFRLNSYGLSYHRSLLLSDEESKIVQIELHPPVDTGPFYLRFMVKAVDIKTGERGIGMAELVKPDRIDIAAIRPFVEMRVHRIDGPNSPLLPLFSGAKSHRLQRLIAHLKQPSLSPGERS
jgi:carotenoid 1,2-hydratase